MDIVILADFVGDMTNSNNRFTYLASRLCEGNKVEVITSDYLHANKTYFEKAPKSLPFKVTMLHEGAYKRNISPQRFLAHYMWGRAVGRYLKERKKPDAVYSAIPPLWSAYEAAKYCEKNNVRFVIDVQDLWPEAFKLALNIPVISDILFMPFKMVADNIYRRADSICAVSRTYAERAMSVNNKVKSSHVVFLGTKLFDFDENVKNNPINKPSNEIWIGYCGTLGASYDITGVIDAIRIHQEQMAMPLKLVVMGDGERREEFEKHAAASRVDCIFTGRLPYSKMCGMLKVCDIAANPIMHNATQSIINKHGDYCAAGLPVINTQESREYRQLVDDYQMGFNVDNGDPKAFAEKIKVLMEAPEIRKTMGRNARRCAEERFDREHTYDELMNAIFGGD